MKGKLALSGIVALLLVGVVAAPALSAPPDGLETYDAGAHGSAFDLQVGLLDLQVAAGLTSASVSSDGPAAQGNAVGMLLAGTEVTGVQAAAPGGPTTAEDCTAEIELPPPLDLTDGTCIAGVSAAADITDGAPGALAASDSLTLSIGGAELTEQLLAPLMGPLEDLLAPIGEALELLSGLTCELTIIGDPILDLLEGLLGIEVDQPLLDILCSLDDVTDIVSALVGSLADAASTTVTITLAPNSSVAGADGNDGVLASASAQGLTVDVLPGIGPNGTSFLEVIVGSSEASVVRDAQTGAATPVANPALAEVNVNGIGLGELDLGLGALLGPVIDAVNTLVAMLADASPLACGEPGPLADIVCLDAAAGFILDEAEAAAEGFDFGEGTVGARTSALRLELLSILTGDPAVSLSLAEAVAAANATPAQAPEPPPEEPPSTPSTEEELPRTGGTSTPMLAIVAGLAGAFLIVRIRRSSLV